MKVQFGRIPFLILAMISLVIGVLSGLNRVGWGFPLAPEFHGPWMVCGFFAVVIGLEKVVETRVFWSYLGPLGFGLGSLVLFLTGKLSFALPFMGVGAIALCAILGVIYFRKPAPYHLILVLGAAALALSLLYLGVQPEQPIAKVVPDWMLFLLLVIMGERVEISQVVKKPYWAERLIILLLLVAFALNRYPQILGGVFILICLWLIRYDLAIRNWSQQGLEKFVSTCLIGGYLWMGLSGGLMMIYGITGAGPFYDVVLHTFFLGFVFSMIFGHAPIVFPQILGIEIPFRKIFYLHWGLLQISLMGRVFADLANLPQARYWTSMVNGVSILLFFGATIFSAYSGSSQTLSTQKNK